MHFRYPEHLQTGIGNEVVALDTFIYNIREGFNEKNIESSEKRRTKREERISVSDEFIQVPITSSSQADC